MKSFDLAQTQVLYQTGKLKSEESTGLLPLRSSKEYTCICAFQETDGSVRF